MFNSYVVDNVDKVVVSKSNLSTINLLFDNLEKDNNKLKHYVNVDKQPVDIGDLSLDAEVAMTKYTNKLRKENAKYAKQKQGKRQ